MMKSIFLALAFVAIASASPFSISGDSDLSGSLKIKSNVEPQVHFANHVDNVLDKISGASHKLQDTINDKLSSLHGIDIEAQDNIKLDGKVSDQGSHQHGGHGGFNLGGGHNGKGSGQFSLQGERSSQGSLQLGGGRPKLGGGFGGFQLDSDSDTQSKLNLGWS